MALATRYYTVNGTIRAQDKGGGDRSAYLPDALGSVTATTDSRGAILNTYRYKPYGTLLAKNGVAADPKFLWVGCLGYRGIDESLTYVRERHYELQCGQWNCLDPLFPQQEAYVYGLSSPTTNTDETGLLVASYYSSMTYWDCRWRHYCSNGQYFSCIKWLDIPNVDGWIMQRIRWGVISYQCESPGSSERGVEYYEAWCVRKSATGTPIVKAGFCEQLLPEPVDIWRNHGDSKVGTIRSLGNAVFIPGTPRDLRKYFWVGAHPWAGILISSINYPFFPANAPALQRIYDRGWECCKNGCGATACNTNVFSRSQMSIPSEAIDDCS